MGEERESGVVVGHTACPDCGSSDALAVHLKQTDSGPVIDAYCWSSNHDDNERFYSQDSLVELGAASEYFNMNDVEYKRLLKSSKGSKNPITLEEYQKLSEQTTYNVAYRGIRPEILQKFGHRVKLDSNGEPSVIYYPETNKDIEHLNGLSGYKARRLPKDFREENIGRTGIMNQLSGQHLFANSTGRYILVVGGENDKAAAYQMLRDMQKDKDYDSIPVVSPTSGEGSAAKQMAANYDFLDQFEWIVVGMDSDEAGETATEEIIKILPSGKVKVATWSMKDPHKMLESGKQKQFVREFYAAKEVVYSGVKTSIDADGAMEAELSREKIPLPPFMSELQKIMAGGIPLGYLVTLGAQTGGGKTTLVNEMLYYWLWQSPYKVGVVSLELNAGQYHISMLSRHIGKKIQLIEDPKEAVDFVNQPWVVEKRKELMVTDDGEPRYVLLDDRDGDLDTLKLQIEKLIRKYGCKTILIDPIQDAFEGASLDEQTAFIKYLKTIIKDGIAVIVVAHITKGKTEVDKKTGKRVMRMLTEDDFAGVSNLAKSSGCTILTMRDKYADDPVEKNTTYVDVGKCRWSGRTGQAGKWYYEPESHTMYDLNDWLSGRSDTIVDEIDSDNQEEGDSLPNF